MERTDDSPRGHAAAGGVVAGLIGGAVMLVLLIGAMAVKGNDIWPALKGSATPFVHERAHQPGFDAPIVALGIVCHFAISVIWGVLFGVLAYGLSRGSTVIAGALWGIPVWLVMYYLVRPAVGLAGMARAQPIANAVIGHVIFGVAVGLGFLPFQRPHARTTTTMGRPIAT